ncbi:MAG: rhodanese-like domain-containing protein [Rhizobiaceae bacterium]
MLKKGFKELLAEANSEIETMSVVDFAYADGTSDTIVVDVRDAFERDAEGAIPGSIHASRGMLEFHADPKSPAYLSALDPSKRLVLYCGTGGRSALAAKTLLDMGFQEVASLAGGYEAWRAAKKVQE